MKKYTVLFVTALLLFLSPLAMSQQWKWTKLLNRYVFVLDIIPHQEGALISAQMLDNNTDFGGYDIGPGELGTSLVAKMDADGGVIWAKRIGGSGSFAGKSLTTDTEGNIFVAGQFNGLTFIAGTDTIFNQGESDPLLLKLSNEGEILWAWSRGTSERSSFEQVAVDQAGNLRVLELVIDINGEVPTEMKLHKLSPGRELLWTNTTYLINSYENELLKLALHQPSGEAVLAIESGSGILLDDSTFLSTFGRKAGFLAGH
jgi:hypothetical protein